MSFDWLYKHYAILPEGRIFDKYLYFLYYTPMHLIIIPLLIITILVGIFEGGDIFKSLNLSLPTVGKDGLNIQQFLGSPGGTSDSDSPLQNLGN